jgi:hypothetical protein
MAEEKSWQECANAQEAIEQIQMLMQDYLDGKADYTRDELAEIILDYTKPHVGELPGTSDDVLIAEVRRRGLKL